MKAFLKRLQELPGRTAAFFKALPGRTARFFRELWGKAGDLFSSFLNFFKSSNQNVRASLCLMGLGQLMYRQYGKGIVYLAIEIGAVLFFSLVGFTWISGFFTLGTIAADPWTGQEGDNSVIMMLLGLFAFVILILFLVLYVSNVKDARKSQLMILEGKKLPSFRDELKDLLDKKFYKSVLFIPILGVSVFSVLPIVFMILIAFTNYGPDHIPPNLVDWTGLESFETIFSATNIGSTFVKILGWNLLWAVASTLVNYLLGLLLALLLSKKVVRGKAFWRLFPILAYAIPGFITLTAFKFMFSMGGPINDIISDLGGTPIHFLGLDNTWGARLIGLMVNAWLTVPSTMLLATGILSNAPADMYEAARIDGASSFRQFKDLTLPFVVFATTPTLITSFINNFNNFGVFYFLRGDIVPSEGYTAANDTDLLINWLYRLSIDNNYYSIGAAVSLLIFLITSLISLIVYVRSPAYRKEGTFR